MKLFLPVATATAMVLLPAFAGPRDDVYAGSARCASIADNRAWLDCFYGSAQPMRSTLGLPPAPAAQTRLVPPAGPVAASIGAPYAPPPHAVPPADLPPPPQAFSGFGHLFGNVKPIVNNLRMASYSFDSGGYFTVTLEDGQVWQQSHNPGNMAKWKGPAGRYSVSVLPGVLGSYDMKVRGIDGYFKVRRVN